MDKDEDNMHHLLDGEVEQLPAERGDLDSDEDTVEDERTLGDKCHDFFLQFTCPWTVGGYLRLVFILMILSIFVLAIIFQKPIASVLGAMGPVRAFVDRIGWIGPVVYAAIYALCTVVMVPGTILTLASGVIFAELWVAFVCISAGSTLGAALAFLAGKTVLRKWVEGKITEYPVFQAVDAAIAKRGVLMVLLVRLSPVIPFNLLNYALSLTGISFFGYVFGSWVGMAPATFVFIFIPWAGIHALDSTGQADVAKILLYVVGAIVSVAVIILVTYFAKRAIDQEMKLQRERRRAEKRKLKSEKPVEDDLEPTSLDQKKTINL